MEYRQGSDKSLIHFTLQWKNHREIQILAKAQKDALPEAEATGNLHAGSYHVEATFK